MHELGIKNFEAIIWFAIFGPPDMPKDLQAVIATKLNKVLQRPDMKEFLLKQGIEVVAAGPEQLASRMRIDHDKWKRVVEISGFEPQ